MSQFLQLISSDAERLKYELKRIGVDKYALKMAGKGKCLNIKVKDLVPAQANIIKQESLAAGMDAAVSRGTVGCVVSKTDLLLMGNVIQYERLIERLKVQPYSLKLLAEDLKSFLNKNKNKTLITPSGELLLDEPKIMGILNITPDSFSDGGDYFLPTDYKRRIDEIKDSGVKIIDIGGESSRPGSTPVDAETEKERIAGAVEYALNSGLKVSVDTYKSEVAEEMLKKGADIINDISGFKFDSDMAKVCAEYGAAVCLMHTSDTPDKMQKKTDYTNFLEDVKKYLFDSAERALKAGIKEKSIILDPGFGFGKKLNDNYLLLKYLDEFKSMGMPILIGVSRKSMINRVTGEQPSESVLASKIAETIALVKDADIVRTHDITEAQEMVKIINEYRKADPDG